MTKFQDGPAKGQTLLLKRTPHFLRVTKQVLPVTAPNRSAVKWDALNEVEDAPKPDEELFAYQLLAHHGNCHINAGRGRGGFYPMVTYDFVTEQPDDTTMRVESKWVAWCESRRHTVRILNREKELPQP